MFKRFLITWLDIHGKRHSVSRRLVFVNNVYFNKLK
jgi:hypothetical protein